MIYFAKKPSETDSLEMTDEHAIAMWIALAASIRSRLDLVLCGSAKSVTFTSFDAKMIDTACEAWLQGALAEATALGILVHGRYKDEGKKEADKKDAGKKEA